MLRVVCDTNVLVSAFIAAGPPSRLVEEVLAGRLALTLPIAVINELERVLTEKLGFEDAQWAAGESPPPRRGHGGRSATRRHARGYDR